MFGILQGRVSPAFKFVSLISIASACLLFMSAPASAACPNEGFRGGSAAALPDCRAYELVTPPDGIPPSGIQTALAEGMFPTDLSSPLGTSFVYSRLSHPLEEPTEPNGTYDFYEALRLPSGWQTVRHISPSGPEAVFPNTGGISVDHQYAFVQVSRVQRVHDGGSLAEGGDGNYLGKPDGSFELAGVGSLGVERLATGRYISPDGEHTLFFTGVESEVSNWCETAIPPCAVTQLEPDAPPTGTSAIYDRGPGGPTRVISLLPGDETPAAGENAQYQGNSEDGSVVAFKIAGTLYLRVDNSRTEEVTSGEPRFAGLSSDGEALTYVSGGDIHHFAIGTQADSLVNSSGDARVVNVSADGSHVYFISPSQLDGSKGVASEPNLYVWDSGNETVSFIATVTESDAEGFIALTNWEQALNLPGGATSGPGRDPSRATFDGNVLVFQSQAQLTSYANENHTEIYRYDDAAGTVDCVSCNLLGPPTGDARLQTTSGSVSQPSFQQIVHNLSEDGSRVFFETPEALVASDVDHAFDVYEWRPGEGTEQPTISLISSGETPAQYFAPFGFETTPDEPIFAITPQGTDVFFQSPVGLLPEVQGWAVYDARIDGGFANSALPVQCAGEACREAIAPSRLSVRTSNRATRGNVKPKRVCRHKRGKAQHRRGNGRRSCRRRHRHRHRRQHVQARAGIGGGR